MDWDASLELARGLASLNSVLLVRTWSRCQPVRAGELVGKSCCAERACAERVRAECPGMRG